MYQVPSSHFFNEAFFKRIANKVVGGECFYRLELKSLPPRGSSDQRQETTKTPEPPGDAAV